MSGTNLHIRETVERKLQETRVELGGANPSALEKLLVERSAGSIKGHDGANIEFKLWLSDSVPGSIVKQVRTARQKGDVLAETTANLESYK